ncbi:S24/S26 family peptidase [Streptomyces sp. NPDC054884]|uniref:S24/S26 family peptidase n=1 Tax=Streptomyces sp. ME08-AFT2 TaxID=3028683 RepID=UPI0029AD84FC|nr:S24/S26 family peptidase [Streptomyces sp. ME08-AFT2]MDX3312766.1 S24/S26 family peptidase [Streptomyces sp. ME08-AFT2]
MVAVLSALLAVAVIFWIQRSFVAVTVNGLSMSPAYKTGDRVLIRRGTRGLHKGRIVVVVRPDIETGWGRNPLVVRDVQAHRWYIKRVVALGGERYPEKLDRDGAVPQGHVMVVGDNPRSVDSKQHGPCPTHQILGIVVRRLPRPADVQSTAA